MDISTIHRVLFHLSADRFSFIALKHDAENARVYILCMTGNKVHGKNVLNFTNNRSTDIF